MGASWAELIRADKMVPFVGNSLAHSHLAAGSFSGLVRRWAQAKEVGYPWPDQATQTLVAQYLAMKENGIRARAGFLAFLKEEMFAAAVAEHDGPQPAPAAGQPQAADGISDIQLIKAREKIDDPQYSLTDLAYDLGRLDPERTQDHPLRALANLPFKVYVTTGYHRFLEVALFQAGKRPVSEVYRWIPGVDFNTESIFATDPGFSPTIQKPLVYHLFGRDDVQESLVLSEGDYLELLINVSRDLGGSQTGNNTNAAGQPVVQGLPTVITERMAQLGAAPLLLGYDFNDWDFRVLFRGLILATHKDSSGEGLIILQLPPPVGADEAVVKASLEKYMKDASKLRVIWTSVAECLKDIKASLQ